MREVSQIKGTNQQEAKKNNTIQEYFQPKISRKIRIFSLGRKNNILIKKKECGPKSLTLLAAEKLEQSIRRPAVKSVRDKIKNFEEKAIRNTKPSIIRLDSQSVSLQAYKI